MFIGDTDVGKVRLNYSNQIFIQNRIGILIRSFNNEREASLKESKRNGIDEVPMQKVWTVVVDSVWIIRI